MKPLNLIPRLEAARQAAETGDTCEDRRIVCCPECDGAGVADYGDEERGWHGRCRLCNGAGREEITVEPITLDDLPEGDACFEHGKIMPCAKCLSDSEWLALMHEEQAWDRNADTTDALIVNSEGDRKILADWSAFCRKRASEIRGRLMAQADREAREAEDIGTSW